MVAIIGTCVFALALAASFAVFAMTLAPAWPRIVSLLRDGVDSTLPAPAAVHSFTRSYSPRRIAAPASPAAWRAAA